MMLSAVFGSVEAAGEVGLEDLYEHAHNQVNGRIASLEKPINWFNFPNIFFLIFNCDIPRRITSVENSSS